MKKNIWLLLILAITVLMLNVVAACKQPTVNTPTEQEPKPISVTGIKLDKKALSLALEETVDLKATVEPSNATIQTVSWSVEPSDVVTLTDNGDGSCTIKVLKEGITTVTAKTADGGKIAQCRIITAGILTNTAFIAAVERAMDSEGKPVNIGWTKEADGTLKLTPENLEAIRAVTELYISGYGLQEDEKLTDLSGIEWFTGLTYLGCDWNSLTSLDVSANTMLEILFCNNNQLTSLDVSNNTALVSLSCSYNNLTSLDVSANTMLEILTCSSNQLTSLDVSANSLLKRLGCHVNQLKELDVSKNTYLEFLACGTNKLSVLNINENSLLQTLSCNNNQLTTLDVSRNPVLTRLSCFSNQLTDLDVSKNVGLTSLDCYSNQLRELDVSKNIGLTSLSCYSNQLANLDISKNTDLNFLFCDMQTSDLLTLTMTKDQETKWYTDWKKQNSNVTPVFK